MGKTLDCERYEAHVAKAEKLLYAQKNKKAPVGGALKDALANYTLFSKALNQRGIATHHLVGLHAFFNGISKEESEGGVLSQTTLTFAQKAIDALLHQVNKETTSAEKELFFKASITALLFYLGAFEMGRLNLKSEETKWREELFVRFFFSSKATQAFFRGLLPLYTEDKNLQHATTSFFVAIFAALLILLYSLEKEDNKGAIEALQMHLNAHVKIIEKQNLKMPPVVEALVASLLLRGDAGDSEGVFSTLKALIEEAGVDFNTLLDDVKNLKDTIHFLIRTVQESKENRPNMIALIG